MARVRDQKSLRPSVLEALLMCHFDASAWVENHVCRECGVMLTYNVVAERMHET